MPKPMEIAEMWKAIEERDVRYCNAFVYSIKSSTSRIFCRPTCTARKPHQLEDLLFFASAKDAIKDNRRGCKRCHSEQVDYRHQQQTIELAKSYIIAQVKSGRCVCLRTLSHHVGRSLWHFHRSFKKNVGMTPKAYDRHLRKLLLAKSAGVEHNLSGSNSEDEKRKTRTGSDHASSVRSCGLPTCTVSIDSKSAADYSASAMRCSIKEEMVPAGLDALCDGPRSLAEQHRLEVLSLLPVYSNTTTAEGVAMPANVQASPLAVADQNRRGYVAQVQEERGHTNESPEHDAYREASATPDWHLAGYENGYCEASKTVGQMGEIVGYDLRDWPSADDSGLLHDGYIGGFYGL